MDFTQYQLEGFYDELFAEQGTPRPGARPIVERIESLPAGELLRRQKAAEKALFQMGITFTVYGHEQGTEKIWPVDIIPRTVESAEWETVEKGLKQRIFALNQFIADVYSDQKILKDKVVPSDLVLSGKAYRAECAGLEPPRGIWCHVTGTKLVRDRDGKFYVPEDNLKCPSGVSYVLENRQLLERTFPHITGSPYGTFQNTAERSLGRLRTEMDYSDIDEVLEQGTHEFLDNLQPKLNEVDDGIFETFFASRPAPREFVLHEQS